MKKLENVYDDEYSSCENTYATLRIYPGKLKPEYITKKLGIQPSNIQHIGEVINEKYGRKYKINGWFLTSETQIKSKDSRRHIDWIISQISNKEDIIKSLQNEGAEMDVACFWLSAGLSGGPILSTFQMGELSRLNIELWFDIY